MTIDIFAFGQSPFHARRARRSFALPKCAHKDDQVTRQMHRLGIDVVTCLAGVDIDIAGVACGNDERGFKVQR